MARRRGGTLVLSGDIHSAWALEGPLGADGVPVAVELVCPPAATTPLGQLFPPGFGAELAPGFLDQLPGGRWVDVDHRGYLTVDLTPDRAEATWWWVDRMEDPGDERPRLSIVPGRRWVVPQSVPGLIDPESRLEADGTPRTDSGPTTGPQRGRRRRLLRLSMATGAVAAGVLWLRSRARS